MVKMKPMTQSSGFRFMKKLTSAFIAFSIVLWASFSNGQTTTSWNSTSSGTWSTAANWTSGSPATGPQVADYAGTATLQHAIDLAGGTGRVSVGHIFDFVAGGA